MDTDQHTQTGGKGHKHHLRPDTQTHTRRTHRPDTCVPAVCQSLCQAACALCPECRVAQERLSQSMAGSLGSACVLDGCPIRRASTRNCVLLTRKDNMAQGSGRAELRGQAVFGQRGADSLSRQVGPLASGSVEEELSSFFSLRNRMKSVFDAPSLFAPLFCGYHTSSTQEK